MEVFLADKASLSLTLLHNFQRHLDFQDGDYHSLWQQKTEQFQTPQGRVEMK